MGSLLLAAAIGAGAIATWEYVYGQPDDAQRLATLSIAVAFFAGAFR